MESRLQSNEVRIPKTSSSSTTITNGILSSNSSALTSISNNVNNVKRNDRQTAFSLPDFDFNSPCQYFKSTFARSLSISAGTNNQIKSLDFDINFGLPSSRNTTDQENKNQTPVAFSSSTSSGSNNNNSGPNNKLDNGVFNQSDNQHHHHLHHRMSVPPLLRSQPIPLTNGCSNSQASESVVINDAANKTKIRNVWSTSHKQNFHHRRSLDSTEIEVLRLRKECQNLIEENRRLVGLASGMVGGGGDIYMSRDSPNIEVVVLQTQVDTLQWQLKQVEASREMYRAVMQEIIRFLERCHRNLNSMKNEQITQSKNAHYNLYRNDLITTTSNNSESNSVSPRAYSSTNLLNVQKTGCQNNSTFDEDTATQAASFSSTGSYNNFRDFTWRRSPKRIVAAQSSTTSECDPEKLAQEAFRLLRTAQNLLNTQEPDLTQPKNTMENQYNPLLSSSSSSSSATQTSKPLMSSSTSSSSPTLKSKSAIHQLDPDSFCLTFSRKMNMRESRLSLRSSTDSSVHSTSSSKNETDEENHHHHHHHNHHHNHRQQQQQQQQQQRSVCKEGTTVCSMTEDESGFSSISSFQEVGIPLNSTMISLPTTTMNSSNSDDSSELNLDKCFDGSSRNSTLKATTPAAITSSSSPSPLNLGNHRRWDSTPIAKSKTNSHRFSTLPSDDSPSTTVLWV